VVIHSGVLIFGSWLFNQLKLNRITMKKIIIFLLIFSISNQPFAQEKSNKDSIKNKVGDFLHKKIGTTNKASFSNEEIVDGLKEALTVGTKNVAGKLSLADGFYKDEAIKILMPDEAKKVETTLRKLKMNELMDQTILSMNRAAEEATAEAGEVFINAIKNLSITDGLNILKGNENAATEFLKNKTSQTLTEKISPIIENSLNHTNATKYWKEVFTNYNKFQLKKINPDLTAYVTEKTIAAIFNKIAIEELNIRKDPAARVTEILRKVFAN
jgi:hypothetical protein